MDDILRTLNEKGVKLIAVSKKQPDEKILSLYERGHRAFGENRVQEFQEKFERLPKDIEWHMIGHLQTNKVKYIAPFVHLIHSVDSYRILKEINKQGKNANRVIPCLLQFKVAEEDTKYGLTLDEALSFIGQAEFSQLTHIEIRGVMGMATYTDDENQVRAEFRKLHAILETLKSKYFSSQDSFREISMGMSGDYLIAIEEGSTMVRIGSLLFGDRKQ